MQPPVRLSKRTGIRNPINQDSVGQRGTAWDSTRQNLFIRLPEVTHEESHHLSPSDAHRLGRGGMNTGIWMQIGSDWPILSCSIVMSNYRMYLLDQPGRRWHSSWSFFDIRLIVSLWESELLQDSSCWASDSFSPFICGCNLALLRNGVVPSQSHKC